MPHEPSSGGCVATSSGRQVTRRAALTLAADGVAKPHHVAVTRQSPHDRHIFLVLTRPDVDADELQLLTAAGGGADAAAG